MSYRLLLRSERQLAFAISILLSFLSFYFLFTLVPYLFMRAHEYPFRPFALSLRGFLIALGRVLVHLVQHTSLFYFFTYFPYCEANGD